MADSNTTTRKRSSGGEAEESSAQAAQKPGAQEPASQEPVAQKSGAQGTGAPDPMPQDGAASSSPAAGKEAAKSPGPAKEPAATGKRGDQLVPHDGPAKSAGTEGEQRLEGLTREQLHGLLYDMIHGRRFEEKCAEAYALGKIGGFCHLYIGQEAVAAGALSVLRPDDYVIDAYRDHVQALLKGIPGRQIMAELYGRVGGSSKGKGGSMHLYSAEHNFMGGWGIVGGQIPLATGIGWAIKYRNEDRVCLCFLGEAAVNQGAFHESLNMAALWKLPVIYIVENNRFGMGTAWERASSLYDISQKASAYDMPASVADGMDVFDMRRKVSEAVERARTEKVPTLIEARCYRFMGHSMSDPVSGVYRTKEEVENAKEKDPVRILIDQLKDADMLTDDEVKAMDERAHKEADDAAEFAERSPEPEPDELYRDVYAQINEHGRLFFDRQDRMED